MYHERTHSLGFGCSVRCGGESCGLSESLRIVMTPGERFPSSTDPGMESTEVLSCNVGGVCSASLVSTCICPLIA